MKVFIRCSNGLNSVSKKTGRSFPFCQGQSWLTGDDFDKKITGLMYAAMTL